MKDFVLLFCPLIFAHYEKQFLKHFKKMDQKYIIFKLYSYISVR